MSEEEAACMNLNKLALACDQFHGRPYYTLHMAPKGVYETFRERDVFLLQELRKTMPLISGGATQNLVCSSLVSFICHMNTLRGMEAARDLVLSVFPEGQDTDMIRKGVAFYSAKLPQWQEKFGEMKPITAEEYGEKAGVPVFKPLPLLETKEFF